MASVGLSGPPSSGASRTRSRSRGRIRRSGRSDESEPHESHGRSRRSRGSDYSESLDPRTVRLFSWSQLQHCTNGFAEAAQVGPQGGFGIVYRGTVEEREVAIKVMRGALTADSSKQFVAEVRTLSRVHHANLIRLIGYCQEAGRCVLVYPFYPGGNLCDRLFNLPVRGAGAGGSAACLPPLGLAERISIGYQMAQGLRYLHFGAHPPVLHRDIKGTNVLLDGGAGTELRAVLADFGLARISEQVFDTQQDVLIQPSCLVGTEGYIAPEYRAGELSPKADVYSFGVLLLEMMTGRTAREPALPSTGTKWQTLPEWVKSIHECRNLNIVGTVVDRSLRCDLTRCKNGEQMVLEMLLLALQCVEADAQLRPNIDVVEERIGHIMNLQR
ncbi:hypothetical protein CBR_g22104 [Chara braunii]|uniref:Protein kinase domain-containing protein n=1 Tax=Chara braunii TaxID=69332 RepID=A0A388L225_CHABU|nr:hypothetical protein CBR_g22104 [Chara braunii]|eukprot:GBG76357.1 hypothetical protein CBR_g22104 [Chara braunii]